MNDRLRGTAGRALDVVARARARSGSSSAQVAAEVTSLRERVARLEDDVHEARQLHRRLAELTDVVEELLVPIAQRDEARLGEVLDRYRAGL